MSNLAKNWPVYILLAGFVWFVVYVYIHSRKQEKKDKQENKTNERIS